jgi:hypothetical protein
MKNITLNIGLLTSERTGKKSLGSEGKLALIKAFTEQMLNGRIVASARHVSSTEPTLVLQVEHGLTSSAVVASAVDVLSTVCSQDCIAYVEHEAAEILDADWSGNLVGDMASAWGPFNAEMFLLLDGSRLSDALKFKAAERALSVLDS